VVEQINGPPSECDAVDLLKLSQLQGLSCLSHLHHHPLPRCIDRPAPTTLRCATVILRNCGKEGCNSVIMPARVSCPGWRNQREPIHLIVNSARHSSRTGFTSAEDPAMLWRQCGLLFLRLPFSARNGEWKGLQFGRAAFGDGPLAYDVVGCSGGRSRWRSLP
jgi:hypothetical protein